MFKQLIKFQVIAPRGARFYTFKASEQPRIRIGCVAPNFQAKTTAGDLDFHDFIGNKWTILFSHPADFTPVCTTELGAFAKLKGVFAERNTQLIGLSADDVKSHREWALDVESANQLGHKLDFPIIADQDRKVAFLYDMVDEEGFKNISTSALTIRNVYIIDPNKKVRLFLAYPAAVGRNIAEILRALDALQLGDKENVVTPANWEPGKDVILPLSVSKEEGTEKYGSVSVVTPYLRYVNVKSFVLPFSNKFSAWIILGLLAGGGLYIEDE